MKLDSVVIIGGTGTIGTELTSSLLNGKCSRITIFSRDEKKQADMRLRLGSEESRVHFEIGDIRDCKRIKEVLNPGDIVINAAALKHVPVCEKAYLEAIKTNLHGAINARDASIAMNARKFIQISTDKAVSPINTLGFTKALSEKAVCSTHTSDTECCVVRYGNVIGSRGSLLDIYDSQLKAGKSIYVTHPRMTRFFLEPSEALDTILKCVSNANHGEIWVRKAPSVKIFDVAVVLAEIYGFSDSVVKTSAIRPGEKIHETLIAEHEWDDSFHSEKTFCVIRPEDNNFENNPNLYKYSSDSQALLSREELKKKLLTFYNASSHA